MPSFSLARNLEKKWPWIVAIGSLQMLIGLLAITFVGVTSYVSIIYLGGLFMLSGIAEIIYAFRTREHGDIWFHVLFGVLSTVCGIFIFSNPVANLVAITMLIAILLLITGIVDLIAAVVERFHQWIWFALYGVVSIAAGFFVLRTPLESSLWVIGTIVGIQMMVRGCAWIKLGLAGRRVLKTLTA